MVATSTMAAPETLVSDRGVNLVSADHRVADRSGQLERPERHPRAHVGAHRHLGRVNADRPGHRAADRAVHRPHGRGTRTWPSTRPTCGARCRRSPSSRSCCRSRRGSTRSAGFKVYPTIVAMVVLAVPPIMVNAYSGLAGVDRDLLEAGRGQGMSERQILRGVELPLSVPVIATGVRSGVNPGDCDGHARRSLRLRRVWVATSSTALRR